MEQELVTQVWWLHGALAWGGVDPGLLTYKEEKISFVTENGEQFNAPVSELREIKWPFYQFGLTFTTVVYGKKYRIAFKSPFGEAHPWNPLDKPGLLLNELGEIATGGDAAKQWKKIFAGNWSK